MTLADQNRANKGPDGMVLRYAKNAKPARSRCAVAYPDGGDVGADIGR